MQFRRSGQRDDRRRRVLLDERPDGDGAERTATPTGADRSTSRRPSSPAHGSSAGATELARGYSATAQRDQQPRTVDLLPTSRWWLGTVIGLLMLPITGLVWMEYLATQTDSGLPTAVAHLQPSLPAGLDNWFTSSLFLVGSVIAWQILALRRHKSNDYRGTYRVWGWIAILLLIASLEATAQLSIIVDGLLFRWSGIARPVAGMSWSGWTAAAVGLALAVRMWFELQESRGTLTTVAAAATCYTLAALAGTWESMGWTGLANSVCVQTLILGGHLFILTALLTFARFVYLDANGLVDRAARQSSRTRRSQATAEESAADARSTEESSSDEAAPKRRTRRKKVVEETPAEPTEQRTTRTRTAPQKRSAPAAEPAPQPVATTGPAETPQRKRGKGRQQVEAANPDPKILSFENTTEEAAGENRKLSKSEKRKLRKAARQQQEQRRAA